MFWLTREYVARVAGIAVAGITLAFALLSAGGGILYLLTQNWSFWQRESSFGMVLILLVLDVLQAGAAFIVGYLLASICVTMIFSFLEILRLFRAVYARFQ